MVLGDLRGQLVTTPPCCRGADRRHLRPTSRKRLRYSADNFSNRTVCEHIRFRVFILWAYPAHFPTSLINAHSFNSITVPCVFRHRQPQLHSLTAHKRASHLLKTKALLSSVVCAISSCTLHPALCLFRTRGAREFNPKLLH